MDSTTDHFIGTSMEVDNRMPNEVCDVDNSLDSEVSVRTLLLIT